MKRCAPLSEKKLGLSKDQNTLIEQSLLEQKIIALTITTVQLVQFDFITFLPPSPNQ